MANSFSTKSGIVSGRNKILDAQVPSSLTMSALVVSSDVDCEWEIYIDRDLSDAARPNAPTVAANASAGSFPKKTTYFARVTAIDVDGRETTPSLRGSGTTTPNSDVGSMQVSWTAVTGATGYRVYMGSQAGMEVLVGETTSLSLVVTTPPVSAPLGIPTSPDIILIAKAGIQAIPAIGVPLSSRFTVFVNSIVTGNVAISCIAQ